MSNARLGGPLVVGLVVVVLAALSWAETPTAPANPAPAGSNLDVGAPDAGAPDAGAPDAGAPDAGPPDAEPDASLNVEVFFRTRPATRARVLWGKKLLGRTPLRVKRPRNSGPMDVVIKAWGYLPVNTRAYTFVDDSLLVELTRTEEQSKLFGYKVKLPAEEVDGGTTDDGEATPTPPAQPATPAEPATSATPATPAPPIAPAPPATTP